MIEKYAGKGLLKILVKPNSPKTEIVRWDEPRGALRVNVSAPPEKGKANKEIIRFFSKKLKKRVVIKKGVSSREKVLRIL